MTGGKMEIKTLNRNEWKKVAEVAEEKNGSFLFTNSILLLA